MATYQEITTAVTQLFNKDSEEFREYLPTAVSLAETGIFNMVPMLACFKFTETVTTPLTQNDDGQYTFSTEEGLEIVRSVRAAIENETDINGNARYGPFKILEKRPDELVEMYRSGQNNDSEPKFWYVVERRETGTTIQLGPIGEDDIKLELRGFGLIETLDPDTPTSTTWISKFAPDALIYLTASHMALFLKYYAEGAMYAEAAQTALIPIAQQEGLQINTVVDKGIPETEAA